MHKFSTENYQFGKRLICEGSWSKKMTKYVNENDITEIELNHAEGWKGIKGLFESKSIKDLFIHKYEAKDMFDIGKLDNLESLVIKVARVETLDGIQQLKKLKKFEAAMFTKLESLLVRNNTL